MFKGVLFKLLFIVLTASETMPQSKEREHLALKEITKANNAFASSLYTALKSQYPGNLIFSPFSLSTVMAMLRVGAKGNTSYAIDKTFKSKDTLNEGYKTFREYFKNIGGELFWKTANQVYVQAGFELNADFKNTLKTYYNYEPIKMNFNNANESAYIINDFFNSTTRGQIQNVFTADDIPKTNGIVLVNAIYFHGHWENKFNESLTKKDSFYVTSTKTIDVDMMNLEANLKYGDIEELGATVVLLPFKAVSFSMIVLLPHKEGGLPFLEEELKTYPIEEILSELKLSNVSLSLPRFEVESAIDLKIPLSNMGLGLMFDSAKADFSGINAYLFVSKAVQKTFIEVNEEGCVATTAATDIADDTFKSSKLSDLSNYRLNVNRPFVTMVYDRPTKSVLFFNVISRPNYTKKTFTTKVVPEITKQTWSSDEEITDSFCGFSDEKWCSFKEQKDGPVFYKLNQFRVPKALFLVSSSTPKTNFLWISTSMIIWTVILAIVTTIFAVVFVATFFNCSKREIAEK